MKSEDVVAKELPTYEVLARTDQERVETRDASGMKISNAPSERSCNNSTGELNAPRIKTKI
jgi:hypothetical protein